MRRLPLLNALFAALLSACGADDASEPPSDPTEVLEGTRPGNGPGGTQNSATNPFPSDPPPPTSSDAPCIIAADCPAGTYCDLGECVQSCSSAAPCGNGEVCSARGRCIAEDAVDQDPAPVTAHAGNVTADPVSAELTELDQSWTVELSSDSDELVSYRVELRAPFLHLEGAERGEFTGSVRLRFAVDPSTTHATVTAGTIVIHTTLGNLTLHPSLRVGLTGRYQGVLRYSSGTTPLGNVGIAVDMLDDNGDVTLRIDPEHSMTFPSVQGVAATGRGLFTFSEGLSVSVAQIVGTDFGAARNHFRRPIGRRLVFELASIGSGRLEGSFEENVYGILEQPITLQGTAYLEPVNGDAVARFDIPEAPLMPSAPHGFNSSLTTFPGWSSASCLSVGCLMNTPASNLACIQNSIEPTFYEQLNASLYGDRTTADPFDLIAADCERELAITSPSAYTSAPRRCALVPPLACALNLIANTGWDTALLPTARATYNRLFARVLAPPLLVAQNHIVQGLKASFTAGLAAQAERLRKARQALSAPATFLLASGALEYLRSLPVDIAFGEVEADLADAAPSDPTKTKFPDSTKTNFPAARALARLLYVLHTLDGEEGRAAAADIVGAPSEKLELAHERGVLGFLEAATLAAVLESWGDPPSIGSEFVGSLTLADRGFAALAQGALAFGVPEGEVPLLYDPARQLPTNFEQLLSLRAKEPLEQFAADEAGFEASSRQFEQNEAQLQIELEGVRRSYEDQIRAICGGGFQPSSVHTDADWALCGANAYGSSSSGELAELTLDMGQMGERLRAAVTRLEGMRQKYGIDEERLAATQRVRVDQMAFIDRQGMKYEVLVHKEGFLNAAVQMLSVASNSSLWNGGAPIAMAAAVGGLELLRAGINASRQRLQTAQQLRAVADENQIELISGMAELKKQLIDIAQLELELNQEGYAVIQADLRRRNLLDRAQQLFAERSRALARIQNSPLQDPMYRILQDRNALQVVRSRAEAQRWLYRAGRALEYEINTPLGDALPRAVLGASNTNEAQRLSRCLSGIFADYSAEFGVPQDFTTTVSVRSLLGFTAPRTDEVTGQVLSEAQLFRQWILRNENIDAAGDVRITFSTNLQPGNELWSSNVCDDKITRVQAQIVGDFQGDNEAEIQLALEGGSVLRRCDSDAISNWDIAAPGVAVVQAGVNTFGEASTSLFGQSVARASWQLIIPSGTSAPANADLDIAQIDDLVLRITHAALPRTNRSLPVDVSCLGTVGAGG